jgi:hypothetical protein
MDDSQRRFAIYLLDSAATEAEPEGRRRLVGEEEIEAYDWDNQVLTLTAEGSQRVPDGAWAFVVMLGRQRLYEGRNAWLSAAAASKSPVIHVESAAGRTFLLIRPCQWWDCPDNTRDTKWDAITAPAVRERFARVGKLRLPRSESSFKAIQESVARIRVVRARSTDAGLELDYDLVGRRAGTYRVREEVELRIGRLGESGIVNDALLDLQAGTTRRRAVFPYSGLSRLKRWRDEPGKAVWLLQVSIDPVLSEAEGAAVGLVEQCNLEHGWRRSPLSDRRTAELPVDWNKHHRDIVSISGPDSPNDVSRAQPSAVRLALFEVPPPWLFLQPVKS